MPLSCILADYEFLTNDYIYVLFARQRLEKLRRDLHFIGAPAASQHTVFVDSPGEVRSFDAAQHFDTPEELLGRTFNRPRHGQLDDGAIGFCFQLLSQVHFTTAAYELLLVLDDYCVTVLPGHLGWRQLVQLAYPSYSGMLG